MTENERNSMDWVFAIVASLVLHAAVVGLFVLTGRPAATADERDGGPQVAAEVLSGGRDVAEPGPQAEEVAAEASGGEARPASGASATALARAASAPAVSDPGAGRPVEPRAEPSIPEFYVVQQGDTTTKIARLFGTTPEELAKVNGKTLRQMDNIWVGQKVRLREKQGR